MTRFFVFVLSLFCGITSLSGQSILSIEEVLLAVESNNYDLKSARQNIMSAEVLTSKYNRGYQPTLALSAGLGYSLSGVKTTFNFNFPDLNIQNIQAFNGNVGVSSDYLLYDGGQRDLRNDQNLDNLDFAHLQVDNISQQLKFNASQIYYSIAQAMYNKELLEESLSISKERYKRTSTYYEYGSRSRVDVLNAEVDISRDSINLLTFKNDIVNLKWQLNQLTLREDTDYEIDTSITLAYLLSNISELQNGLVEDNKELRALRKNVEVINFDLAIANKLNAPQIFASGGYTLNYQKNDSKSQLDLSRNNGLNLGLSANWNILDGGQRKVQEQLAMVDQSSAFIDLKNKENELIVQLNRLWNSYQNNLLTIKLEKKNIRINEVNFELVKSLYENGQQSSVEFRQAQLNLINAQSQFYNVQVAAKLQEVEIDFLLAK